MDKLFKEIEKIAEEAKQSLDYRAFNYYTPSGYAVDEGDADTIIEEMACKISSLLHEKGSFQTEKEKE